MGRAAWAVRYKLTYNMKMDSGSNNPQTDSPLQNLSRRRFLQFAGGVAGVGMVVASAESCRKTPPDTQFIGRGDTGLLNFLYIVEQVLTQFYTQANNTPYYGLTASEMQLLADQREHQYAHRELLKKVLGDTAITGKLVVNLSPVTFADRNSTLTNAIFLEDLAVAAYNGVARHFSDTNYVLTVAKMATVQARHAAYARDILTANTFSDTNIISVNGLDRAWTPQQVMAALAPYIQTKLDYTTLP